MATDDVRFQALLLEQKGETLYQFSMTADDLASHAKVERFGESSEGVNRKFDERHALKIAQAMIDGESGTLMLDAICGDLRGNWRYEKGFLIPVNGAFLSIDDGQHRFMALTELMTAEEREGWMFTVTASKGLPVERRLRIFRQQMKRKTIDTKLDLAQRHKLDEWKTPAEREAYKLLLQLNSDPDSPLKGIIILDETVVRTYEHQHRPEGISAAGLWQTVVSAMSKRSPLYGLAVEKRVEVIRNMIRLASEMWPNAWKSPNHILCTSRGINAVLKLMVSSPEFRGACGDDYTVESLRRTFELAKGFKWDKRTWRNSHPKEITESLNTAIGSGLRKRLGTVRA